MEEPMSLKSQVSLHLERIETPKGLDRHVRRQPSSDTSSGGNRGQNPVSKRLDSSFDSDKMLQETTDASVLPRCLSLTSNLPALLKSVASLAECHGIPIHAVWQDIRQYAQQQLLQRLIVMAEEFEGDKSPGFVYKSGSVGMCYVKPTESSQRGCASYERLPPVTIRPILDPISPVPGTESETTNSFSARLMSGKTVTSVIPSISSEEHVIKRYLLKPKKRHRILQNHQGSLMAGEDLGKLFRKAGDKGFICFHYRLDRGEGGTENLRLVGLPKSKPSLVASNAQLVVTMKRGVGGTAGMKSEARLLDKGALLGLLLGEDPESLLKYYAALSKIEGDPSRLDNLLQEDEELLEDKPVVAEKKLSLHSLCCRVDLYLDKDVWAVLSGRELSELMAATRRFGEHFSDMIREQNWSRHLNNVRVIRASMVQEMEEMEEHDEDLGDSEDERGEDGDGDGDDRPQLGAVEAGKVTIREQIDALLDEAMGTLHTKDHSKEALGQQSFLKMHVSCLALAAGHKRTTSLGHSSHAMPMYMVSTRDCFSSDIIGVDSRLMTDSGREFIKTRWFIQSIEAPANFDVTLEGLCSKEVTHNGNADGDGGPISAPLPRISRVDKEAESSEKKSDDANISKQAVVKEKIEELKTVTKDSVEGMVGLLMDGMLSTVVHATESSRDLPHDCASNYLLPLGVTTYNGLYQLDELVDIESRCDDLHQQSIKGILPKECYHETSTKTGSLKRTKYFFGSRYLWSREQLKSPHAKVAGGIRRDVPKPPVWMKDMVEQPIVSAELAPKGFVDAIALNMYHDGSEGIQSHYDDAKRFQQPIYSLRLFSDSRLSFGTQLYGFTNGLFFVPMPRGCVTVMEHSGYAANGVKHCVRPIDMTGKSAAMILRKINNDAFETAGELFWKESLHKLSSLSLEPANPEDLIWNPLFNSDAKIDKETALLLQKHRNEKKEEKVIKSLLKSMIKEVLTREKRRETRKRKLTEIMSGMVKRVCTAELLGIDLCGNSGKREPMTLTDDPSSMERKSSRAISATDLDTASCTLMDDANPPSTPEVFNDDILNLFNLVDDMVSFVEHPAYSLKRKR